MQRSRSCSLSRGMVWVWPKLGPSETTGGDPAREAKEASSRSEQPANGSRSAAGTSEVKLRGIPEVIDTATMRLEGKVVRLFGVEWVRVASCGNLRVICAGAKSSASSPARPIGTAAKSGGTIYHELSCSTAAAGRLETRRPSWSKRKIMPKARAEEFGRDSKLRVLPYSSRERAGEFMRRGG